MTLDVRKINISPVVESGSELSHIQRLADLHAIGQLVDAYPILVDSHDLDALVALFTHDAQFHRAGSVYTGHDELRRFYEQLMGTYSLTVHTVHQHLVDLDLGAGVATGVQMGHGEVAVDGRRMLASYRYDDKYRWEDGRWLFARRVMRYQYFASHEQLGDSLAGRQRVRVAGAEPRDAEIPEDLASHRAWNAARAGDGA